MSLLSVLDVSTTIALDSLFFFFGVFRSSPTGLGCFASLELSIMNLNNSFPLMPIPIRASLPSSVICVRGSKEERSYEARTNE